MVDVVKNQAWCLGGRVSHDVSQLDDIGVALESEQYFRFALNLALLHWLEHFDDHARAVRKAHPLIDVRVFATPDFSDDLVLVVVLY